MVTIAIHEADINLLGLAPRIENALKHADILNIGELSTMTTQDIAAIPEIGPAAIQDIVDHLQTVGITLPKEPASTEGPKARERAIPPKWSRVVGRNIRLIREARNISRQQMSWEMHQRGFDISEATLKNMELGQPGKARKPRRIVVDELHAFAEVLDTPIEEFFKE